MTYKDKGSYESSPPYSVFLEKTLLHYGKDTITHYLCDGISHDYKLYNVMVSSSERHYYNIVIQGGEDSYDALSCRSFFAKEPLIIGHFRGNSPVKIRHLMTLRHPVVTLIHYCDSDDREA